MTDDPRLSRASAARLSLYLRCLEGWERDGRATASSRDLADALGVTDAQVRRDLACLGGLGRRGVGYGVPALIAAIRQALGINREWPAVLVGAGNLARALLRYRGFAERGFRIVALFDADAKKVGERLAGLEVRPVAEVGRRVRELGAELGIVAVPSEAAQEVGELLAAAGVRGVLNFAPAVLRLPEGIAVVNVDLTIQLEQLAFQVQAGRGG
ncbi:MAG TPA: redox-sensing transcriptional repressor Rex [Gemmataceae bacterium]|nr:redox-sensing transcriptional repressor Rex [Gemmataceae bacterium]